jgi:hypothetical protein
MGTTLPRDKQNFLLTHDVLYPQWEYRHVEISAAQRLGRRGRSIAQLEAWDKRRLEVYDYLQQFVVLPRMDYNSRCDQIWMMPGNLSIQEIRVLRQ